MFRIVLLLLIDLLLNCFGVLGIMVLWTELCLIFFMTGINICKRGQRLKDLKYNFLCFTFLLVVSLIALFISGKR